MHSSYTVINAWYWKLTSSSVLAQSWRRSELVPLYTYTHTRLKSNKKIKTSSRDMKSSFNVTGLTFHETLLTKDPPAVIKRLDDIIGDQIQNFQVIHLNAGGASGWIWYLGPPPRCILASFVVRYDFGKDLAKVRHIFPRGDGNGSFMGRAVCPYCWLDPIRRRCQVTPLIESLPRS